jgi:hydrogenase large subunit
MKLTPEVNLLAVAHYLQALEVQRYANKIVSILGSKSPHIQNVAVGGVANPLAIDSQSVLTVERLLAVKEWIDKLNDFVKNVYLIDVAVVGGFYADWTTIGRGIVDYISVPDIPLDGKEHQFACPAATSPAATWPPSRKSRLHDDAYFRMACRIRQAFLVRLGRQGSAAPVQGRNDDRIHRLPGQRQVLVAEVADLLRQADAGRPAARVLAMVAAGHEPTIDYATHALDLVSTVAKTKVGIDALHSTIGRHAARAVRAVRADELSWKMGSAAGQHGQGRPQDLQQAGVPERRDSGRRLPRSPARRVVALDRHPGRQDQELPVRRTRRPGMPHRATRRTHRAPTRPVSLATRLLIRRSRSRCCAPSTPSTRASLARST